MVIDDDPEFLSELKEMLAFNGYDVLAMSDGKAVLDTIKSQKPDLIMLDLKMKPISGFELADKLKNMSGPEGTPIIAMTGFYTLEEHRWLMNICGIKRCIKKPFSPQQLNGEISAVLTASGQKL